MLLEISDRLHERALHGAIEFPSFDRDPLEKLSPEQREQLFTTLERLVRTHGHTED
jgi:hypothetical protein